MSGPSLLQLGAGLLVDSALQSSVLLGVGFGLQHATRAATAATRHVLWAVTLAALPATVVGQAALGSPVASTWTWVPVVWAAGAGGCLAVQAVGWLQLWRLGRSARRGEDGTWSVSTTGRAPFTWGLWRPIVAMPAQLARTPERRAAAMAHEHAHIARHDWAVHTAATLVCAVFWFQPLVWWARAALEQQAEHAADDAVLTAGFRPSAYARLLVDLASPPHATALGAARSSVGRRVVAVLAPERPRASLGTARWPVALAAAVGFAAGVPWLPALSAVVAPSPPAHCQPQTGASEWHVPMRP